MNNEAYLTVQPAPVGALQATEAWTMILNEARTRSFCRFYFVYLSTWNLNGQSAGNDFSSYRSKLTYWLSVKHGNSERTTAMEPSGLSRINSILYGNVDFRSCWIWILFGLLFSHSLFNSVRFLWMSSSDSGCWVPSYWKVALVLGFLADMDGSDAEMLVSGTGPFWVCDLCFNVCRILRIFCDTFFISRLWNIMLSDITLAHYESDRY